MIPLPSWVDAEAWAAFVAMRKSLKKPLTHRAAVIVLRDLCEIRSKGHDPNAALDQSTLCCWLGVWPAKDKQIAEAPGSDFRRTQERLRAESERKASPPPAQILQMRRRA